MGVTPTGSVVGDSCQSGDSTHVCLALRYLAFNSSTGDPSVTEDEAITNVRGINTLWQQCDVGFEIAEYDAIDPTDYGIAYSIANYTDLETIRNDFNTINTLLVVTTGTWDRSGTLGISGGNGSANAWTSLPGGAPYGAILEYPIYNDFYVIAHELGHYLNLVHVADTSDLMNPVIYSGTSTQLTAAQCQTARSTATSYWQQALRH